MLKNNGYSFKTDIFSLGVILFNLITGKQLFSFKGSKCPFNETSEENIYSKLYGFDNISLCTKDLLM